MFFIALHKSGMMQTWNICTGKLMYIEVNPVFNKYKEYVVYCANKDDKSNTRGFGQGSKNSVSLIKGEMPIFDYSKS